MSSTNNGPRPISTTEPALSGLFYFGTSTDVRLGDQVEMHRWLRRPLPGVVCYIPGLSQPNTELEYEDVKQWAIRTREGSFYPILYDPASFQPPKRIRFVARGTPPSSDALRDLE